jgi:hypothetical protein
MVISQMVFSLWSDIIGIPTTVTMLMFSDEGLIFTDPGTLIDAQVQKWMAVNFPYSDMTIISEITSWYPPPVPFSSRYATEFDRLKQLISG